MENNRKISKIVIIIMAAAVIVLCVCLLVFRKGHDTNSDVMINGVGYSADTDELILSEWSDEDLPSLSFLPSLRTLDLRQASISVQQAQNILNAVNTDTKLLWMIPVGGNTYDSQSESLVLSSLSKEDLPALSMFSGLKALALPDNTVPDILNALVSVLSEDCTVDWSVTVGGKTYPRTAEYLDLSGEQALDADELAARLASFTNLNRLTLNNTNLSPDWIREIAAQYPKMNITYDIPLNGTRYDSAVEEIDLSGTDMSSSELIEGLAPFKNLKSVDLHDCALSETEMQELYRTFPDLIIKWTVTLYRHSFESTEESLDFSSEKITDDFAEMYEKLPFFRNVTFVDVSYCSLSYEKCDALNKAFPDIEIVWTITLRCAKTYRIRTDAVAFSTALAAGREFYLTSATAKPLQYCTKMEALDLGHNVIHDFSFLENMPNLRILIIAGCGTSDISVLAKLDKLEYLELFANKITDLSPLAGKESLVDLNICFNKVSDLTPLYTCKNLDRLWACYNSISDEQKEAIQKQLPNCTFYFDNTIYSATAGGWREHERYFAMREFFNLPPTR